MDMDMAFCLVVLKRLLVQHPKLKLVPTPGKTMSSKSIYVHLRPWILNVGYPSLPLFMGPFMTCKLTGVDTDECDG